MLPLTSSGWPSDIIGITSAGAWSRWFYAGDEFPCLQIVWPDRAGLFPWEERFDRSFENGQIALTETGWPSELAG